MALTEEQKRMLRERASKNVEKINGKSERKQPNRYVENTPMPSRGNGISQQQVVQPVAKIFCKNCGNIVDADSKVCAFCGQMLGGGIQQVYIPGNQFQQNVPPVNNNPKTSSFAFSEHQKEIIGGILGIALIIVLLFVAYHNFQRNFGSDNRSEIQIWLDEYEDFADDYIDVMKRYKENPTDSSLISEYTSLLQRAREFEKEAEQFKQTDMSEEDYQYFAEVYGRIMQKCAGLYTDEQDGTTGGVTDIGNTSENVDDISSDLNLDDDGIAVEDMSSDSTELGESQYLDGLEYTLLSVETVDGEYKHADEGNVFYAFNFEVYNGTDSEKYVSSSDIVIYCDDYLVKSESLSSFDKDYLHGRIMPDKRLSGCVVVEIPIDFNHIEINIKSTDYSSSNTIKYDYYNS